MLAQPMSHTTPTALMQHPQRQLETAGQPLLQGNQGYRLQAILRILTREDCRQMVRISACARVRSTPGLSFPTAW